MANLEVFSVGCVVNKVILMCMCGLLLVVSSVGHAGINPFKKTKNYTFGSNIAWYEHNKMAVKTGSVRDGSDTNYYHLNIDNDQLLLRLGKNDPSGELENTRMLDGLSIVDIKVDGQRLPLFGWCLNNQQNLGNKLKQNAIVANGVCINAGGGGDFVMRLDNQTRTILQTANVLEFSVEPYGRTVKLTFSMLGYTPIMDEINKPVSVVVKPVSKPVVVVVPKPKAKPKVKPKPKPKLKPKPKPKPVKMCYARAPVEFKAQISTVSYPCNDKAKKASAESKVAAHVKQQEDKKAAVDMKREMRQRAREDTKREAEWDTKQSDLWINRCKKHWSKNSSPCYCEKYLDQAPKGIKNTCGK